MRRHRLTAFGGAQCEILVVGCSHADLSAAVAEVYAFETRLTRFDPRSELSLLNAAAGARVAVTPLLEELLRTALEAHALSDGMVNAAVLPALVAAGYDRTIAEVRRRPALPATCAPVPVPPLDEVLEVGEGWARLRPGAAVDLGGVGKGWLADRLAERLENAVVNLGGDLRALGAGPDGAGWTAGLCDGSAVRVIDAGIATSGRAGRRWAGGHHLVDPLTGRPAPGGPQAVTVVAATALHAEVLAKLVALRGLAEGVPLALARGAERVRSASLEEPAA
ncbi:MAG TPA: FAD:protein FMN transferase [Candidatus Dormibacteraeota bacterium]|nr:FAD:protein FMN transferase [Candidatus Dormibacteraeota bacterium]